MKHYHVQYFDRHYAESRHGSSAHTVHELQKTLDARAKEGWEFRATMESSMGWILIFERDD